MSDINLMPLDSRDIELKEWKKKQAEKSSVRLELSNPSLKKQNDPKGTDGFLTKVKKIWQGFFDKKDNDSPIKKNISQPLANIEIPRQQTVNPEPTRKIFYQNSASKNLDKDHETETKVTENIKLDTNNSKSWASIMRPQIKEEIKPEIKFKNIEPKISNEINSSSFNKKEDIKNVSYANVSNFEAVKNNFDINLMPVDSEKMISDKMVIKKIIIILLLTFLVSFGVYMPLMLMARNRENTVKNLETATEDVVNKINTVRNNNKEVEDFLAILQETKNILENHIYIEKIFIFLEQNTLKTIYYDNLKFDYEAGTINLIVNAKDYHALAEQILIFQNLKEIVEKVDISAVALEKQKKDKESETEENKERLVTFNLSLKIKPDFLFKK